MEPDNAEYHSGYAYLLEQLGQEDQAAAECVGLGARELLRLEAGDEGVGLLGGEAAHGMLVLGPRAVARLETYRPAWPLPKLFQLISAGKLNEGIFRGETINTPSLLVVEDAIDRDSADSFPASDAPQRGR
jgi:hypothetical protein